MKVLYAVFVTISTLTILRCQVVHKEDSGQYVHDTSGQYVHDDSGRYIPDHSGDYRHDGQGNYLNEDSGFYKADASGIQQNQRIRNTQNYFTTNFNNNQQRKNHLSSDAGRQNSPIGSINLLAAGSTVNTQIIKPAKLLSNDNSLFGNVASAATPIRKVANVKFEPGRYVDGIWKIIRQAEDLHDDGYHWEYETENGITAEESGQIANKGTDKQGMRAKGFYQYTGPDKILYSIGYTADENGFIPVGNHIPTPPPVPIEIQRSLDYLRSLGKI